LLRIIRPMMEWNLQSHVSDVLALGPRTAGQLAAVGIRTVDELVAARPYVSTARMGEKAITADVFSAWQCESRLILALPQLPSEAARLLAAAGFGSAHRIGLCSPTELLAAIETAKQKAIAEKNVAEKNVVEKSAVSWLAETALPTIAEVSEWIRLAGQTKISRAA